MPKRGENIRKRKDGRWEGRYIKARDESGRALYGFIYGKTYTEVKQEKLRRLTLPEDTQRSLTENQTLEQQINTWLAFIYKQVRESTYAKYSRLCKTYICPFLGKIKKTDLTTAHIKSFTDFLLQSGGIRKNALSVKTVTDILTVTRQILKFGKIAVEVPIPKSKKTEIHVLSVKEQIKLESLLAGSDDLIRAGILLDLYTGLRLGELCALKWTDFDFVSGYLRVRRSVSRIQNPNPAAKHRTKLIVESPKTDTSERCIPLPDFLLEYLRQYCGEQETYLLTGTKRFMEPRAFSLKYKKILKQCSLDHYNFHALRHTFATRCIENGFDIKSLSEILGHADVRTTLSRYVHPSMEMKRKEMNKLSNVFYRSSDFSQ